MAQDPEPRKTPLIFFRAGRAWLKEFPEADRQAIGKDLLRARWQWPVGMPLCRPVGDGCGRSARTCRLTSQGLRP